MQDELNKSFQDIDKKHYLQVFKRYPITLDRGEGSFVYDVDGNKYLDALGGIAVNGLGHCHPNVVTAIQNQAAKLMHISNFYLSKPQAELAEKLVILSGLDRVFLTNSGAESVKVLLKLQENLPIALVVVVRSFRLKVASMGVPWQRSQPEKNKCKQVLILFHKALCKSHSMTLMPWNRQSAMM